MSAAVLVFGFINLGFYVLTRDGDFYIVANVFFAAGMLIEARR